MATIGKIIVERTEKPFSSVLYGHVERTQKTEEVMVIEKTDNLYLPNFDKVQLRFSTFNGDKYKVTIDKFMLYYDSNNCFSLTFTNTNGCVFDLNIDGHDNKITLFMYTSYKDYENVKIFEIISNVEALYDEEIEC